MSDPRGRGGGMAPVLTPAALAAFLVVILSDTLGAGAWVFAAAAGVVTYALSKGWRSAVATVILSGFLVFPMIALVVFGAYFIDSLT